MQRLTRLLLISLFALVLLPSPTAAADFQTGETITPVQTGQTLDDDLYVAGQTVTISGTVNGDVIAAGSKVIITGTVTGSVWAAGSDVTISGTVNNSVRAAGSNVTVTGKVDRDVLAAGSNVNIASGSTVGRDVVTGGNDVTINGSVGRNVKVGGQNVTIGGPVAGSVNATVQSLKLAAGAKIGGTINYNSPKELSKDPAAQVIGAVTFNKVSEQKGGGESFPSRLAGQFYWFLASVLLMLGILLYARRAAVKASDLILKRPLAAGLTGLGFLILTPLVMFVFLILIVGIPLSLITLLGYILVIYSAKIFVSLTIGHAVLRQKQDKFWFTFGTGILGLALFYILATLPFVGMLVTFLTVIFGAGAQLLLFREVYETNKKKYGV
ncbi:hypothetical protein EXS54_02045 [Patescibacteria group bacterium]|nr:hypothetical protein [Patescibacteria group bacterium]